MLTQGSFFLGHLLPAPYPFNKFPPKIQFVAKFSFSQTVWAEFVSLVNSILPKPILTVG